MDDLVDEEDMALQSYKQANEGGFRRALSSLMGKVHLTRVALDEETLAHKETQKKLSTAMNEFHDLEEKYELGQNEMERTTMELAKVKVVLEDTGKTLERTSDSLDTLTEERQSLQKLGRQAWRLSRERVGCRIQNVGHRLAQQQRRRK